MALKVVTPPVSFLTPADITGSHSGTDAKVQSMIDAVVSELDAPNGWLGRAIGEQTLCLTLEEFGCEEIWLPYPDVSTVVSVKYLDTNLIEQTVDPSVYRLAGGWLVRKPGKSWPTVACDQPDAVRIIYTTGYDEVPDNIKYAIILMVQQLKNTIERSESSAMFLQSETVEGVGQFRYSLDAKASEYVQRAATSLLSSSRVFR